MSKKSKFYLFIFCLIFNYETAFSEMVAISLGRNCQPAARLRQFNLRHTAYPFDWVINDNFDGLIQCVDDNFDHFLTAAHLFYNGGRIENKKYSIDFYHDFPTIGSHNNSVGLENELDGTIVPNYFDFLPEVQKKYHPRINRFLNTLTSNDEVVFFRTDIGPESANRFVEMLSSKYPSLNYILVVVHGKKDLQYNWNIPHVANFYVERPDDVHRHWWHETEWLAIFKSLNLIKN